MVNIIFTRDQTIVGSETYESIIDVPEIVTFAGRSYRTEGTDTTGRTASHSEPIVDDDGTETYALRVVDVE